MTYAPPSALLRGLSLERAECYGKPHIGAFYAGAGVRSNRLEQGAWCAVCGRPATNAHHCPPVGTCGFLTLPTAAGDIRLRPALFALCGSGTTGCHNGFHGGSRYRARWAWNSDALARDWWEGRILMWAQPHDRQLYALGHWEIEDRLSGRKIEIRG
ncbi:hypothetical protein [Adlercreutzia caecimuris]|uniref:hypothetical protein n=1 Tax=Adlercreutzia caecimuris TaxID=671266 RepID=UPI00272A452C|nr:hypothetical protein [Adlercreutzia caecimuris]